MARKRYSPKIRAQAYAWIVYDGLGIVDANKRFVNMLGIDKAPSKSTLANWAGMKDEKTGRTWFEKRQEMIEEYALSMSPEAMTIEFMRRVKMLLSDKSTSHGTFADAISKMSKSMKEIIDPSLQFPSIFFTLNDQLDFIEKRFKDTNEDNKRFLAKFLEAYRDHVRDRMLD